MRFNHVLALGLAATATLTVAAPADAKQRRSGMTYGYSNSSGSYGDSSRTYGYGSNTRITREETMTDILANNRDPSGNYRGYPNWARAAFAGSGRN